MGLYRKRRRDGTEFPTWYWRFQFQGREYKRDTGHEGRREAAREGRRLQAEIEHAAEAEAGPRPRLTLAELSAIDIADAEGRGVSTAQLESVEACWVPLLAYFGEDALPEVVDYESVQRYVAWRRDEGLRGQSIRKERQALVRGLKIARRRKELDVMPELPRIKSDPAKAEQAGTLHPLSKIWAWLDALDRDTRAYPARHQAEIVLRTGLRAMEVRRLRWSWVELLPDGSELPAQLHIPAEAAKTRTARTVGLPAEALALILELQAERGNALLCPAKHCRAARKASERIGWSSITLRDLRHTYASLAAETGDVRAVQAALGHTSLTMTQRYLHSTRERTLAAGVAVTETLRKSDPDAGPRSPRPSGNGVGVSGFEPPAPCSQSRARQLAEDIIAHPDGPFRLAELHEMLFGVNGSRTPGRTPLKEVG